MRSAPIRAIYLAVAVTVALMGLPAPAPVSAVGGTVSGLFLDGEPGDWVSSGHQWAFVAPAFTIVPGFPSPDHNFVSFRVEGQTWNASIDAPAGQALAAGASFPATTGIAPAGTGILWITGDGRACSLRAGSVSVLEAAFDESNAVSAFAADFWMDCNDAGTARLYGSIRYHSSFGIRAITLDNDLIAFGDTVVGVPSASRVLTIENDGTSAVQFSDPTFEGPDSGAFEIVGTPCAVVLPGNDCTVSFRVDTSARGPKHADLVIPDSTLRGERRVALSTTAYQTTTTAIVVTDMEPDGSFGPAVTVTVSPNPGPLGVSLTWTGGGGSGDPGRTSVTLDPGQGDMRTCHSRSGRGRGRSRPRSPARTTSRPAPARSWISPSRLRRGSR